MPSADAFVRLTADGLAAIETTLEHLDHRDDPEDVHALRVGIRKMRARMWIFAPVLPERMTARWKSCLRDLAHAASPVRDWDVFLDETVGPARELEPDNRMLGEIADTAGQRRATAREAMLRQVHRFRTRPLPRMHADLLHVARLGTAPADTLGRFAEDRLRRPGKRWRKGWTSLMDSDGSGAKQDDRGSHHEQDAHDGTESHGAAGRLPAAPRFMHPDDPELPRLHKLRIAGKRLRYAIEALDDVLPRRYRKRLHRKLVKGQGRVGRLLDGTVARRLMAECLGVPLDIAATGQQDAPDTAPDTVTTSAATPASTPNAPPTVTSTPTSAQTPAKSTAKTSAKAPARTSAQTSPRTPAKTSGKTSAKTSAKTTGKTSTNTPGKTPAQTSAPTSTQTPTQTPAQTSDQMPAQTSDQTPAQPSDQTSAPTPTNVRPYVKPPRDARAEPPDEPSATMTA